MRDSAPRPACTSGSWWLTWPSWPTKAVTSSQRVTSSATPSAPPPTSATPLTARRSQRGVQDEPGAQHERRRRGAGAPDAPQHLGRALGVAPDDVRLAQRRAHVVASGDRLLELGGVVGPRHLLGELAPGHLGRGAARTRRRLSATTGKANHAGHQVTPGDHPGRTERSEARPAVQPGPAQQRRDLAGVVVDAVEQLADALRLQGSGSGCANAAPSRSARSRPSARPTTPENRVRPACRARPTRRAGRPAAVTSRSSAPPPPGR
jgi:hypothetical protein